MKIERLLGVMGHTQRLVGGLMKLSELSRLPKPLALVGGLLEAVEVAVGMRFNVANCTTTKLSRGVKDLLETLPSTNPMQAKVMEVLEMGWGGKFIDDKEWVHIISDSTWEMHSLAKTNSPVVPAGESLRFLLYRNFDNRIRLIQNGERGYDCANSTKVLCTDYCISPQVEKFWEALRWYLQSGISRVVYIHGPPGMGKTQAAERLAGLSMQEHFSGNIIEFIGFNSNAAIPILNFLRPDCVIINDLDRDLSSAVAAADLAALTALRANSKLVLITANERKLGSGADSEATLRVERVDMFLPIMTLCPIVFETLTNGLPESVRNQIDTSWPASSLKELKLRVDQAQGNEQSIRDSLGELKSRHSQRSFGTLTSYRSP